MGNCCASSSNPELIQQREYIPTEDDPEFIDEEEFNQASWAEEANDDEHDDATSTATTRNNTPFEGTPLNETTITMMLPLVDPRLVSLLDFFRQLSVRRKDIFNEIIPVHRQDFEAIFSKMRTVQRVEKKNSKMGGIVRQRSLSFGDAQSLKSERCKVKPIDSGGKQPPTTGVGAGGSKPAGSK